MMYDYARVSIADFFVNFSSFSKTYPWTTSGFDSGKKAGSCFKSKYFIREMDHVNEDSKKLVLKRIESIECINTVLFILSMLTIPSIIFALMGSIPDEITFILLGLAFAPLISYPLGFNDKIWKIATAIAHSFFKN